MESLYIVMPAYNEESNILEVVKAWYPKLEKKSDNSRLIIADSGSTDNTHIILKELKNEYPKLEILSDTGKQHGPKLIALYKKAIEDHVDYVFQTDSDGQTNPEEFNFFWDNKENYVAIIGTRPVRGDGKSRAFVEKVVCLLLRIIFGVKVKDANAPYRLMKTDTLAKYVKKLPEDYNIPNIMLTTYYEYYKENYMFKDISFKARQGGKNSINIAKITKIGINSIKSFYKFKREL